LAARKFPIDRTKVGLQGDLIAQLDQFERKIKEKMLISAVAAGAKVMYDEVKLNVPVDTGKLRDSIYRFYDKSQSGRAVATYIVGPNKRKSPHWFVVEYGHWRYNRSADGRWLRSKSNPNARGSDAHNLPGALDVPQWVPANPYLRRSYDSAIRKSLDAIRARLAQRMHAELNK